MGSHARSSYLLSESIRLPMLHRVTKLLYYDDVSDESRSKMHPSRSRLISESHNSYNRGKTVDIQLAAVRYTRQKTERPSILRFHIMSHASLFHHIFYARQLFQQYSLHMAARIKPLLYSDHQYAHQATTYRGISHAVDSADDLYNVEERYVFLPCLKASLR